MTSARCLEPVAFETLVAYWSGDLPGGEAEQLDDHLMGCGTCSEQSGRVAGLIEALRSAIPPLVTDSVISALRGRGLRVVENAFAPGERKAVVFAAGVDLLIHRLNGLDLTETDRIHVTLTVEETGDVLLDDPATPFERASSEVLICCQRHFAMFPPNLVAEVRAHAQSGREQVARYAIPHLFEQDA